MWVFFAGRSDKNRSPAKLIDIKLMPELIDITESRLSDGAEHRLRMIRRYAQGGTSLLL